MDTRYDEGLRIPVSTGLKQALIELARRERRTMTAMARVILEDALEDLLADGGEARG